MRWTRKLWRIRGMQRHNPTATDDERVNDATVGTAGAVVTEDIKRRQISLVIRYVATARAR
jgi:hypothetical protein